MSAMQRSLPLAVSNTFVCVLTSYFLGFGELVWRVEVDAGRVRDCILKSNRGGGGGRRGATRSASKYYRQAQTGNFGRGSGV